MRVNKLYSNQNKIEGLYNLPRFIKLMQESISKLELNLENLTILTEAASGNYICTPIIASMSRAKKVYAYAKNSKYGTAEQLFRNTEKLAKLVGINGKIIYIKELDENIIRKVDIVTNLGQLRPIKKDFINKMKETAVIPLMRETWEFRDDEIDLEACRRKGIIVLGTNENHPDLRIFDYLGHLCAKKLFESGIEIFNSKIIVFGGGNFGLNIMKYLAKLGAEVKGICEEENFMLEKLGIEKIGSISRGNVDFVKIKNAGAIIVTTYPDNTEIIGTNGLIKPSELKELCPGVSIIQFKGNVDRESIIYENIPLLPKNKPKADHMSWTLNELGPKPIIDLHAAGLKVGEIIARIRKNGCSPKESIEKTLENSVAQDFSREQKKRFNYLFN